MRGRIGVLGGFAIGNGRTSMIASFSTSGGEGRGRGRGGGVSLPNFVVGNDEPGVGGQGRGRGGSIPNFVAGNENVSDEPGVGAGHGRGIPGSSNYVFPSFVAPNPSPPGIGVGRGRGGSVPGNEAKTPIFLKKDEGVNDDAMGSSTVSRADFVESVPRQPIGAVHLPENMLTSLTATGAGRGKPQRKPSSQENVKDDNRHLRPRRAAAPAAASTATPAGTSVKPKINREEAIKKAVGVLSRGDEGRTFQRGPGGGDGGGRRRVGGWKNDGDEGDDDADSEEEDRLLGIGDDADAEKLANKLGPTRMALLSDALDEMLEETIPEPGDDEILEAYDTNLKIELEPEYLMGDFETNPDINETPPIPLRDALEKMKPFLMAYEGIEDQEEWEQAVQDAMENVPLMKEIVDHYCGPDRVTAKQQHEELERVANTLPVSAPNSVKRFTDRAVLSLQSNPGWGFHRKCQFMDKLVDEFSKSYK